MNKKTKEDKPIIYIEGIGYVVNPKYKQTHVLKICKKSLDKKYYSE